MLFPAYGVTAIDGLMAKRPDLLVQDEVKRRQLTRMIVEQMAHSAGALAPRWGCKKRTGLGDDLQSADSIAWQEGDGTISIWDWQHGPTLQRQINTGDPPTYPNTPTSDATFMPVTPTDHLGTTPPPDPSEPPVDPPPIDPDLAQFMADVRRHFADIRASLERLEAQSLPPGHTDPLVLKGTAKGRVPYLGTLNLDVDLKEP